MNISDLYRDDLLTAAKHPDNVGSIDHPDLLVTEFNTACGDQVTVAMKLDKLGKKITEIKWQGNGCLISQTAMSQVSNLVKGQTLNQVKKLSLDQLLKVMGLEKMNPARQRCAELGLKAVQKAITQKKSALPQLSRKPDYIFVGSQNPVKIQAVVQATEAMWPQVKIMSINVPSLVDEQPRSDEETKTGSVKRAEAVLKAGLVQVQAHKSNLTLGVGLEGGVFENNQGELWSTVWVTVIDESGQLFQANGARFKVPDMIAKPILAGQEMGPVVSKLMGGADIKRTNGAIGVITKNFVDRTEEYAAIVKMAIGLWYGQDWQKDLISPQV